jgi:hypothetical protein
MLERNPLVQKGAPEGVVFPRAKGGRGGKLVGAGAAPLGTRGPSTAFGGRLRMTVFYFFAGPGAWADES